MKNDDRGILSSTTIFQRNQKGHGGCAPYYLHGLPNTKIVDITCPSYYI